MDRIGINIGQQRSSSSPAFLIGRPGPRLRPEAYLKRISSDPSYKIAGGGERGVEKAREEAVRSKTEDRELVGSGARGGVQAGGEAKRGWRSKPIDIRGKTQGYTTTTPTPTMNSIPRTTTEEALLDRMFTREDSSSQCSPLDDIRSCSSGYFSKSSSSSFANEDGGYLSCGSPVGGSRRCSDNFQAPFFSRQQVEFIFNMLEENPSEWADSAEGPGMLLVRKLLAAKACSAEILDNVDIGRKPPRHRLVCSAEPSVIMGGSISPSSSPLSPSSPSAIRASISMDDMASYAKKESCVPPLKLKKGSSIFPSRKKVTTPEPSTILASQEESPRSKFRCFKLRTLTSASPAKLRKEKKTLSAGNSPQTPLRSPRLTPDLNNLKRVLELDETAAAPVKPPTTDETGAQQDNMLQERADQFLGWVICKLSLGTGEKTCIDTLLNTYLTVTSQQCLLTSLIQLWQKHDRAGDNAEFHRYCVFRIAKRWIKRHFETFDKATLRAIVDFIEEEIASGNNHVNGLRMMLLASHKNFSLKVKFEPPNILDFLPAFFNESRTNIAHNLMWCESRMFVNISIFGILQMGTREPMISRMVEHFNHVSVWIAREIVKVENRKHRIVVLKNVIGAANACRQSNNFNSLMEILAGLGMSSVQRLKKTWDGLPSKYMHMYKNLEDLMDHHHNFANYRKALSQCTGECLPYLGVFLRDIAFTELGNTAMLNDDRTVNYERVQLLASILKCLQQRQETLRNVIGPESSTRSRATSKVENTEEILTPGYEEHLRKMSFKCEPPSTPLIVESQVYRASMIIETPSG